jgi:hypothetical protein
MAYGDRLRALELPLRGWASAVVIAGLAILAVLGAKSGFPPAEFPVAAVEHLPAGGNLLAPDKYGGFLIYRFNGARLVYFDGRSDYYGAPFLKEYVAMIELRTGWEETVRKYGFTSALLPARFSLVPALEKLGWKRRYADESSVLLERNF